MLYIPAPAPRENVRAMFSFIRDLAFRPPEILQEPRVLALLNVIVWVRYESFTYGEAENFDVCINDASAVKAKRPEVLKRISSS